jgi:hypothetical protein
MPGGFQIGYDVCNGNSMGAVVASGDGTAVAPSASANTKGSWVQMVASSASDIVCLSIYVHWFSVAGADQNLSFDIGVGAGGSEKIIIPDVNFCAKSQFGSYIYGAHFPIQIPAATRVAVRCQCNLASGDTPNVLLVGYDGAFTADGVSGYDTIGFTATKGTAVTSGNGAKGSYTQLVASSAKDYCGFVAVVDTGGVATPPLVSQLVDIAVGAAASEKIIIPDQLFGPFANGIMSPLIPVNVPAGTRLSARVASDGTISNISLLGAYI